MYKSKIHFQAVAPIIRELQHVQHEIGMYVRRDLLLMMQMHPTFAKKFTMNLKEITCTYNTICCSIDIEHQQTNYGINIYFQEENNQLIATTELTKPLETWTQNHQQIFAYLLAVFYKKSGIELVKEHIELRLHQRYPNYKLHEEITYDIHSNHIVVYLNQQNQKGVSLQNIRRKLFSSKDIYQDRMYFDRELQFSKHKFHWKNFNDMTEEQQSAIGAKYQHFI